MGQILSRPSRFWRRGKCQKEAQDRPGLTIQATETQGDVLAVPASSSRSDERYQPASKLMDTPLDLVAVIFDHLEVPDAVAFSLACKGLHHHLFASARSRLKDSNYEDHYQVQTMLEKDLPHDQIYCPFCKTFHTLDLDYRRKFCREQDNDEHLSFATSVPGKLTYRLKYLDARATMNAVLFERPCALDALTRLRKIDRSEMLENSWQQFWSPKIIGGQLFLQVGAFHARMRATEDEDKDAFSHSVCNHVNVHGKFPHMWVHGSQLTREYFFFSRDTFAATCRLCDTDWKLEVQWLGDEGEASSRVGWKVAIMSWHCLGDFRTPFNWSWALRVGEQRNADSRWIDGDTHYIIDHDDWERQIEAYEDIDDEDQVIGSNEKSWIHGPEWGVDGCGRLAFRDHLDP